MSAKETVNKQPPAKQQPRDQQEMLQLLQQMNLAPTNKTTTATPQAEHAHKFWNTQPVPSMEESPKDHGAIDPPTPLAQVRHEPYKLPVGFEWDVIDMKNPAQVQEVYQLLTDHYIEDETSTFRFDYSVDFLKWMLLPPGYFKDWHVAIRSQKTKKMMALITGVPAKVRVYETIMLMAEINFLCIHQKLRAKRLAPVLIKEIARRVKMCNIWAAVYTAGVMLPTPVGQCRFFHRLLSPKKLVECGFTRLPPRITMTNFIKRFRLPEQSSIHGFRPMQPRDVAQVGQLLAQRLQRYELVPAFTQEEVAHWMLPREGVMSSFVVENTETHEVTDFCSFYQLSWSVLGNPKHSALRGAYSFYNVANSVTSSQLMTSALIMAKQAGLDVFNALNVMDNAEFLEETKFAVGGGELQYYLYNWRCPRMPSNKIGLVLC